MPQTRRQRQLQAPTISLLDHVDDDLLALVLSNCAETELRHAFTVCKAFQSPAAVQLHKRCCIALVGSTPQGLQSSNLGVFIKRTELVNGYPSYITAGDETIMLWHAGKRWWIHEASMVGQRYGWISVIDAALSPESVKAAWKVWDDHRKEWFEAAEVRCIGGNALAGELVNAASRIALVGSTPQGLRSSKLGVFTKRTELVNGYPSYIRAGDETTMLWHAENRWWINKASMVGQPRGWISVIDAALTPESVKAAWKVNAHHRKEWFEAPGVRVLVDMVEPTRRFWNSTTREWLELSHLCIFEAPRHAPPGHERRI